MRITAINERTVNLKSSIANAVVNFSTHTVSLVAVVSDQIRDGKPVVGLAFNSIGRFAQGGILRERLIPRLLQVDPSSLLNKQEDGFDADAVVRTGMCNEKPGGHGDRAGAMAALELAIWDLNAKLAGEPAYIHIARHLSLEPPQKGVRVYAAGGYYYPGHSVSQLRAELMNYRDSGYHSYKIKIGGASLADDMRRVETAIDVAEKPNAVAVDANGRFDLQTAKDYGAALSDYDLSWFEEPCDPLDFTLMSDLSSDYQGPLATGENLFSAVDTKNLTQFAGLRPDRDILQMDPGLSYGLTEYLQILQVAGEAGFKRSQCIPHGGHLINLHIVAALGLGGCEAYPGVFQPFGGFSPQCTLANGYIWPDDAPGFGLEQKQELAPIIASLTEI